MRGWVLARASFEEIHVIDVEGGVHYSLEPAEKLQFIDFSSLDLPVLFQHLNPVLLPLDLRAEVGVIVDEVVEQRRYCDVVVGGGVGVGVDAQVEVDRDHRVVDHPAASVTAYNANMNTRTSVNSRMERMARSTKNLTRLSILVFS
jgi:hypothetical protein